MELCIFPLHNVLFPGLTLPVQVFEDRYKRMMARVLAGDRRFGIVLIRRGFEVGGPAEPFEVGTIARVIETKKERGGRLTVATLGENRFRIRRLAVHPDGYLLGDVGLLPEPAENEAHLRALADWVRALYVIYLEDLAKASNLEWLLLEARFLPKNPAALAYRVAAALPISPVEKQRLLELDSMAERLAAELVLLRREQALAGRLGHLRDYPPGNLGYYLVGWSN
jgi:Lon protease-like protein